MTFVEAAKLDEVLPGEALGIIVNDVDIALIRDGEVVRAISDWCSHAEVPLSDGEVECTSDSCEIECMLHGSRFDVRTGEALNLPATKPIGVFNTKIEGDTVWVDLPEGAS
jgi:3-phenylpropionate/trans-cinnamate dioxygenase ferredoxin component